MNELFNLKNVFDSLLSQFVSTDLISVFVGSLAIILIVAGYMYLSEIIIHHTKQSFKDEDKED